VTSTTSGGRPVDLDLLADYLDGLLPESDAAEVETLIATDPEWARTRDALRAAQPRIEETLRGYATPAPMPADVAGSLDAMFAQLAAERTSGPGAHDAGARIDHGPAASRGPGRQDASGPSRPPARSRRRLLRTPAFQLSAAAVVLVAILGTVFSLNRAGNGGESGAASSSNGSQAGPMLAQPQRPGLRISVGTSDVESLRSPKAQPNATTRGNAPLAPALPAPTIDPAAVPPALSHLTDPVALNACLSAVEAAHSGRATAVVFTTYRHQPALIVTLAPNGLLVAVGATCGAGGADEIGHS